MGSDTLFQDLLQKKKRPRPFGSKLAPQCHSAFPGDCSLKLPGSLPSLREPLPQDVARDRGRALGETGRQETPSDSLFPSLKLGLGVAVPGGTGWQLLPLASGGRGGRSSQFQKGEGGGPAPDPDAACQDKRLLWYLARGPRGLRWPRSDSSHRSKGHQKALPVGNCTECCQAGNSYTW